MEIIFEKYQKDLEEMVGRNAEFAEYYHKLLAGVKDLDHNHRAIYVYGLLNAVREMGIEIGKKSAKESMKKFLNQE